ncbi:unnamed protein product [Orchesella dallaii]|uniref:Uncharacterized protein n=1 Tax=Orchesella dallaii TaxID=48710 RepID=A0ABP1R2L0_9HEXA
MASSTTEVKVDCFTNFQRLMWYSLSQGAVSRFYIKRDDKGQYWIKTIGFFAMFFYWFMWINTTLKVTYLVLSYHGWLGIQVHFLDQMSIWDWYLSAAHMIQEQVMWYPKYPLFEYLYRQWELQDIFTKLGMPANIAKKITATDKINIFYSP